MSCKATTSGEVIIISLGKAGLIAQMGVEGMLLLAKKTHVSPRFT